MASSCSGESASRAATCIGASRSSPVTNASGDSPSQIDRAALDLDPRRQALEALARRVLVAPQLGRGQVGGRRGVAPAHAEELDREAVGRPGRQAHGVAGAHDAEQLPRHDLGPGREHGAEHRADAVEARVLERKLLHVGSHPLHVVALVAACAARRARPSPGRGRWPPRPRPRARTRARSCRRPRPRRAPPAPRRRRRRRRAPRPRAPARARAPSSRPGPRPWPDAPCTARDPRREPTGGGRPGRKAAGASQWARARHGQGGLCGPGPARADRGARTARSRASGSRRPRTSRSSSSRTS